MLFNDCDIFSYNMQEKLANEAISYTLGQLPLSHYLADFPHHVPPCHNLHKHMKLDEEEAVADATHFFKQFPYVCSFPVPISPVSKLSQKVLNGIDPATALIREKIKWEKKKRKIVNANKKDTKHINSKLLQMALSNTDATTLLPRGIAVLAAHLQADPDSQFIGNYNWYYSGGNLATLKHCDETYLLSTSITVPGVLSLAKLRYKLNALEMDNTLEPFILDNSGGSSYEPILEVVTEKGLIATRQKSRVHLIESSEEDREIKLNIKHCVQSKQSLNEGFVSVALSNHVNGEYCVLSNCGIIRLYQLNTSQKCVSSMKLQPGDGVIVSDKWASIQYSDPNLLLFTDRCCVHLFDLRCGLDEVQRTWCPMSLCERCEQISVCTPSSIKSEVKYVGTNHQTFMLDIRAGFNQRWTHLMHSTPYIGFTTPVNESCELLVLAGQSQNSVSAMVNSWKGNIATSCNIPYTLSCPMEGLESLRAKGDCLQPMLISRCNLALTGLAFTSRQHDMYVLRSTSVGDVFCQHMQCKRHISQLSTSDVDYFNKLVIQNDAEPVRASGTHNFGDIFEAIGRWRSTPSSWSQSKLSGFDSDREEWQVSKASLEGCVDMLAAPILSVWGIDNDEEWEHSEVNTVEEQDAAEKVLNWLGNGSVVAKLPDTSTLTGNPLQIKDDPVLFAVANAECPSKRIMPDFSSPALLNRMAPSEVSTSPSAKIPNHDNSVTEKTLKKSAQLQTARKKFVSGF